MQSRGDIITRREMMKIGLSSGDGISKGWVVTIGAIALLAVFLLMFQPSPDGEQLFRTEGCMNCHTFKGKGGEMGPNLTSVTRRRSDKWIRQQIRNSKENNPNSRMPSFAHLSARQINAIIRYLHSGVS